MNILITGSGSGIGKAVAEVLSKNHNVYGLDLSPDYLNDKVKSYKVDITSEPSLLEVKNEFLAMKIKFDAILNFAGIFLMDNFLEISESNLTKIFNVNLLGAVRVNKTFFSLLKPNGKILITTSEVATQCVLPFNGIYQTTKIALDSYAKVLRNEAGLLGIKVITLRPGAVKTPLAKSSIPEMEKMTKKSNYFNGQAERFKKIMQKFTGKMLNPTKIGKKVEKILNKKRPKNAYGIHRNIGLTLLSVLPEFMQIKIIKTLVNKK